MPLIQILMKEGTPLIWAIPSTGSLYKDNEGYKELFFFYLYLTVATLSTHLFFHWHWNLLFGGYLKGIDQKGAT